VKNVLNYDVQLKQSEEGFAVWVPGLPGCASQGKTEAEALKNIAVAIEEYLAALSQVQQVPGSFVRTVQVPFPSA